MIEVCSECNAPQDVHADGSYWCDVRENVVYNGEEGLWYREGDDHRIMDVVDGKPRHQFTPGVVADSYGEAFEKLFGHSACIPQIERSPRRADVLA